jgi:ubiquinone biosynthesis UbiH/UbiF/VisC/COQ6 family hydroxylase
MSNTGVTTHYDLIVVGAGPAGLSLVARLAQAPLRIALIDKARESTLAAPADDGREIALTQRSVERLGQLGVWRSFRDDELSPLVRAEVFDGASSFALAFADRRSNAPLGVLAPNAAIRRVLFEAVRAQRNCDLFAGTQAEIAGINDASASVRLGDGRVLSGKLVIAADSRFSALRKAQGIGAYMLDFGRTMMVARVAHARAHGGVATEWFDHGQTIAMLPLNGKRSSFVLTSDAQTAEALAGLDAPAFAREAERRTQRRWGEITAEGARHCYPLVAVYAHRFAGRRFALLGDAAVGMHPVTAHGFNFGLRGAFALSAEILRAARHNQDIADPAGLRRYERGHRRATLPLFTATNALARFYADDRPLARLARGAGLRAMALTPGARNLVEASLRH